MRRAFGQAPRRWGLTPVFCSPVASALFVKLAVFHDGQDVFTLAQQARNVGQRVALHQQQVGFGAGFVTHKPGG